MFGRATFEVQIFRGGRWSISEVLKSEAAAKKKASELLAIKKTVGVRIIKEAHFGKDSHRESEIFKEMKEGKSEEGLSVTGIGESPICEKVTDYYKTASRTTMARLFTKYLEKHQMTPFEMLHSHKNLKRLINFQTMVPTAVDKIATLHARATGKDTRTCRDDIFDALDVIAKKAREAEQTKLPELSESSLGEVLARIDSRFSDQEERTYLANVALTRASINWRGWIGKMGELLPMAQSEKDQRARDMIDEILADIFIAKTVIKDVIGISKHLGDAILRMIDLLNGECAPTKLAAEDLLELLNALFAADLLPRSKQVLFDRIGHDLKSAVRLTNSEDKNDDRLFFDQLVDRILLDDTVIGGSALADGLTERWARLYDVGGAGGRSKAMQAICEKLKTGKRVFIYLLALYDEKAEPPARAAIEKQLQIQLAELNSIQKIAPEARTEKRRLQQVADVQRMVLDSNLTSNLKAAMAKRFDDIVVKYIISEKVIERIDNKRLTFRQRADRLVNFCASGALTEGRATDISRKTVTNYLRRKDFVSEYTADIPDRAEKEEAVRDFYKLLSQTGFEVKT